MNQQDSNHSVIDVRFIEQVMSRDLFVLAVNESYHILKVCLPWRPMYTTSILDAKSNSEGSHNFTYYYYHLDFGVQKASNKVIVSKNPINVAVNKNFS